MCSCESREDVKTEQSANRTNTVERMGEAYLQTLLEHIKSKEDNAM